jgi:hypothetical protein
LLASTDERPLSAHDSFSADETVPTGDAQPRELG